MTDKRQQWETIKTQAPEVADWLVKLNTVFGKPAAMRIELTTGESMETGQFKAVHPRLVLGQIRNGNDYSYKR
jgi:hypothetical protein